MHYIEIKMCDLLRMSLSFQVIDFRKKLITYYDSMNGINDKCLNALK